MRPREGCMCSELPGRINGVCVGVNTKKRGLLIDQPRSHVEARVKVQRGKRRKHVARLAGDGSQIGIVRHRETRADGHLALPLRVPGHTEARREVVSVRLIYFHSSVDELVPGQQGRIESCVSSPYDRLVLSDSPMASGARTCPESG